MSGPVTPVAGAQTAPFASLDELRARHEALLEGLQSAEGLDGAVETLDLFLARARATGALLDSRADRRAAQSILDYWVTQLYRSDQPPIDGALEPFDPKRAPLLPDELCPYVGLGAFVEEQHSLFYGRHRLVQQLVARLGRRRVLVLVGESGSGKSSLARAGLIPALKAGGAPGSAEWHFLPPLLPGSKPLANLARLLLAQTMDLPEPHVAAHARALAADPAHLGHLVAQIGDRPVLLLVDQFEELFTLCRDEAQRRAFVACLLRLAVERSSPHRIVLTMRSDFETNVAKILPLQQVFEAARVQVTPLSAAELREAIEEPARRVGLRFADGIIEALVRDTLGEVAALPLLQATLLQLWRARERNRVTLSAFQRVGGGREALARAADAFYAGLPPEQQITARRVLLRMVRPAGASLVDGVRSEGLEVTSNRIRRRDLLSLGEAPERIERVVDKLVEAGLVRRTAGETPEDEQVEVAHEALVRNWPTLVSWIDEEREHLRKRLRLTDETRRWLDADRRPDLLWRGEQLREAMRDTQGLTSEERSFIVASLLAEEKERERERLAREARVEAERERAEAERERAEAERERAEAERERAEAERIRAETREHERDVLRRRARLLGMLLLAAALLGLVAVASGLYIAQDLNQARLASSAIAGANETAIANRAEAQTQAVAAQTQEGIALVNAATAVGARDEAQAQEATALANAAVAAESQAVAQTREANARATAEVAQLAQSSAETAAVEAQRARDAANAIVRSAMDAKETADLERSNALGAATAIVATAERMRAESQDMLASAQALLPTPTPTATPRPPTRTPTRTPTPRPQP